MYRKIAVSLFSGALLLFASIVYAQSTPEGSIAAPNAIGTAPFAVTFYVSCTGATAYDVLFGDNTELGPNGVSQSACNGSLQSVAHTYQTAGDFTAQLKIFVQHSNGVVTPQAAGSTAVTISAAGTPPTGTGINCLPGYEASLSNPQSCVLETSTAPNCVALLNSSLAENDTDAMTSGDVTRLQTFLKQYPAIYPAGEVTGFYGSLTAAAVQAFEAAFGHGPQCPSMDFTASPSSGTAPLSVTLSADNVNELYYLSFGDGSANSDFTSVGACSAGTSSNCTYSATHTYQNPGTYYPLLMFGTTTGTAVGIAEVTVATSTATTTKPTTPPPCAPTQNLAEGESDATTSGNVTVLQTFLENQGYFNAAPTGTFGSVTEHSVLQFQANNGIEATGFVGYLTRTAMAAICSNQNPPARTQASFNASPNSGSAPLAVTFSGSGLQLLGQNQTYVVKTGDGNSEDASLSGRTFSLSYTYQSAGTFTAALDLETNLCGGSSIGGCVSDLQVGAVTVTVGASASGGTSPSGSPANSCQSVQGGSCQGASGTYPNYAAESLSVISNKSGAWGTAFFESEFTCVNGVWMCESNSCTNIPLYTDQSGQVITTQTGKSFVYNPSASTIYDALQQCTQQ